MTDIETRAARHARYAAMQTPEVVAARKARFDAIRAERAGQWVIRSMSTTDAAFGQKPEPYHIYLLPRHERIGAYWANKFRAALFASEQDAKDEAAASKLTGFQVVPFNDEALAPYWAR